MLFAWLLLPVFIAKILLELRMSYIRELSFGEQQNEEEMF